MTEKHNRAGLDILDAHRDLHLMMLMDKRESDDKYKDYTIRITRSRTDTLLRVSYH